MMKLRNLICAGLIALAAVGCTTQADTVSTNISKDADSFKIQRRIVFYNGITGDYILVVEGRCSLGNYDSAGELSVTCALGDNQYKKHYLGLSDNVTFFAEQVDAATVDKNHYKVIFRPQTIVPDVEVQAK